MSLRPFTLLRLLLPVGAIAVAAGAFALSTAASDPASAKKGDNVENSDTAVAFRNDMRALWEDHIVWTRLAIISLADGLPDQDASVGRLLQNQTHIGDAVKPYYGEAAGDGLTALLHDHITIAADLVLAAKAGDGDAAADASARWYANADDIAAFLSAANAEAWPLDHMRQMMREHLDLTLAEAQARLTGNYAADVAAYDAIHGQILEMADMLSLGIINQFPKAFK